MVTHHEPCPPGTLVQYIRTTQEVVVELLEYPAVLIEAHAHDFEELVQERLSKAVRRDEQTGWRCCGHIEKALRWQLEDNAVVDVHRASEVRQVNMRTD